MKTTPQELTWDEKYFSLTCMYIGKGALNSAKKKSYLLGLGQPYQILELVVLNMHK